jgi:hypothetical protein
MGVKSTASGGFGEFVPELTHCFLPGCKNCGSAHPLADVHKFVPDKTICPDCGVPVAAPGRSVTQTGQFGSNFSVAVGRKLMAVGRLVGDLAKRI